jgi:hypothetical protein
MMVYAYYIARLIRRLGKDEDDGLAAVLLQLRRPPAHRPILASMEERCRGREDWASERY